MALSNKGYAMKHSGHKSTVGQTKSTGCHKGNAGGIPSKIGGGTTFRAKDAGRIMSGGAGSKTGNKHGGMSSKKGY